MKKTSSYFSAVLGTIGAGFASSETYMIDGVGVYRIKLGPSSQRVTPNHRRQTGAAAIKRAAKKAQAKRKAKQRGAE